MGPSLGIGPDNNRPLTKNFGCPSVPPTGISKDFPPRTAHIRKRRCKKKISVPSLRFRNHRRTHDGSRLGVSKITNVLSSPVASSLHSTSRRPLSTTRSIVAHHSDLHPFSRQSSSCSCLSEFGGLWASALQNCPLMFMIREYGRTWEHEP